MVEEPAPWLMSVLLWGLFFLYLILPFNPSAGELCGLHDSYFAADGRLPLCPPDQDLWEDEDRCRGKCHVYCHVYSATGSVVEVGGDICSTFIIEFCMGLLWLLSEATSVSTWKFLTRTDLENSLDLSLEKSHLFWSQHPFPCSWVTSHHGPS